MRKLDSEFMKALPVIQKIQEAGYEAYFVGGSVRDRILKKPIADVDIATSAFPMEVKEIFPRTVDVGIEHGTVMVLFDGEGYEVTTFRTESTYQDYRRPDTVTFVRSLEEDLKRRDFTVNALAMNSEGELIDYFGGLKDIEKKIIKAVGSASERFHEDALRMMRGVRFVSQLNFSMETKTELAIKEHHALLEKIAVERIQVEFVKLLLGQGRQIGLRKMIETELYQFCPGLASKKAGLTSFATLETHLGTATSAWTLLTYFIELPVAEIELFLRNWKCSKKEIKHVIKERIAFDQRLDSFWTKEGLYQAGLEIALEVEALIEGFQQESHLKTLQELYEDLPIKDRQEMQVSGSDLITALKRPAGPWLGELLANIEQQLLIGAIPNQKQAILEWALVADKGEDAL